MSMSLSFGRRRFLQTSAAALAASAVTPLMTQAAPPAPTDLTGRMYKTLKIGMVRVEGSLVDKFKAVKAAGFHGIEMDSPGMNVEETKKAIAETGLPVDGTVCSSHWNIRHTSPDAATRAKALEDLKTAIRDTHAVGGNTVLLVVGKGSDGPESEIWPRSIENIAKALPLCGELGMYIAIENVWNQFLYDHEGDSKQTADKFVKYVDELNSPWVGMQFDIGNHWKYGSMGDWIRQLGKRVVKLDVKGFSRAMNKFTKIDEGDIDWADVRKALLEIHYSGWVAAEVSGGGPEQLREISVAMDKVFGLKAT
ncbi:MAG: sugar phosphate isomerase/epimerase family protein [Pirellulales bacterium]